MYVNLKKYMIKIMSAVMTFAVVFSNLSLSGVYADIVSEGTVISAAQEVYHIKGTTEELYTGDIPDDAVCVEAVPSKKKLYAGEEFYVDFKIKNNPGFYGFGLTVQYDDAVVEPISYDESTEIGKINALNEAADVRYTVTNTYGSVTGVAINAKDWNEWAGRAENGKFSFAAFVGGVPGGYLAEGDGIMFRVPFRAKAEGSCNITPRINQGSFLLNANAGSIESYSKGGVIDVDEGPEDTYKIQIADDNTVTFTVNEDGFDAEVSYGKAVLTENGVLVPYLTKTVHLYIENLTLDDFNIIYGGDEATLLNYDPQTGILTFEIGAKKYYIELFGYGDVDFNSYINVVDCLSIINMINGMIEFSEKEKAAAEVNGDNIISVKDALYILGMGNGYMTFFPPELGKFKEKPISEISDISDVEYSYIDSNGNEKKYAGDIPEESVVIEAVPSISNPGAGEEFYVDFMVKNNPGFSAYGFTLEYDPDVIEAISYDENTEYEKINKLDEAVEVTCVMGNIKLAAISADYINGLIARGENGKISFTDIVRGLVGLIAIANGDGIMFRVPFRAKTGGKTNILLHACNGDMLIDKNAETIPSYSKSGTITVRNKFDYYDENGNVSGADSIPEEAVNISVVTPGEVTVGEEFYVDFDINNNPGFLGFDFMMGYNPAVVEPVVGDIEEMKKDIGVNYTDRGSVEAAVDPYLINESLQRANNGSFTFAAMVGGGYSIAEGDGVMFRVKFKAIAEGQSLISIGGNRQEILISNEGNIPVNIPVYVRNSSVSVEKAKDVTGITISDSKVEIGTGSTVQLSATVSPANATNKNVIWESDNTDVATVDENGLVKAISEGTAVISASTWDNRYTSKYTVTVNKGESFGAAISGGEAEINVGNRLKLTLKNDENKNVVWSSSNSDVVFVEQDGTITGKAAGSADITVTVDEEVIAEYNITVNTEENSSAGLKLGDVDGDGVLTAGDAALVLQKVLNMGFLFPTEKAGQ